MMNQPNDLISQTDLDRLIEGELSATDRITLIRHIEAHPENWRHCAIAFLEAQAWRSAFRTLRHDKSTEVQSELDRATHRNPLVRISLYRGGLVAAGVVLAFLVGLGIGHGNARSDEFAHREQRSTEKSQKDVGSGVQESAEDPGSTKAQRRFVGRVKMGNDNGSRALPIVAGAGLDEEWLRTLPPMVSPDVQEQLEREGWQVEEQRRLVTVELTDGQRLTIPFYSLTRQYVGHQVY